MAKNWAIAIGINQYDYLQPLNYAKRDALLMQEFLSKEAGFERIYSGSCLSAIQYGMIEYIKV